MLLQPPMCAAGCVRPQDGASAAVVVAAVVVAAVVTAVVTAAAAAPQQDNENDDPEAAVVAVTTKHVKLSFLRAKANFARLREHGIPRAELSKRMYGARSAAVEPYYARRCRSVP